MRSCSFLLPATISFPEVDTSKAQQSLGLINIFDNTSIAFHKKDFILVLSHEVHRGIDEMDTALRVRPAKVRAGDRPTSKDLGWIFRECCNSSALAFPWWNLKQRFRIRSTLVGIVRDAGFTIHGVRHCWFPGGGYTLAIIIGESTVDFHTWPEFGKVDVRLFFCNFPNEDGTIDPAKEGRDERFLDGATDFFGPRVLEALSPREFTA